jgi:tRNA-2-methylthio-N6-dimethylallyladenosine synthase
MNTSDPTRKVHIRTYGCQMNVYDSERMADALTPHGYALAATEAAADLILLNTCHIREKAAEKVYSELGRIRRLKTEAARSGRRILVGVAGCVAQAEGAEIARRAPVVDVIIGPTTYHRLPDAIARARNGERVIETDYAVEDKFEYGGSAEQKQKRARQPIQTQMNWQIR